MPLPFPDLDDRSFEQLVRQARDQIDEDLNSDWNDLSPGDPGIVLLEAFAYLTEQMIYRLNRLPRKVYIAFLRMLGVTIAPPIAAHVLMKFWHPGPVTKPIPLPRGSRVSTAEGNAMEMGSRPVFSTARDVEIPPTSISEATAVSVPAYHCEWVTELLGLSTGVAGQVFQVRQPPIVAWLEDDGGSNGLKLGIEVVGKERRNDDWADPDSKTHYRLWKEVESFSTGTAAGEEYRVDRQAGLIFFAPAARSSNSQPVQPLAAVPPAKREVRVWYAHGGGTVGNCVDAGQLKTLIFVPGQPSIPVLEMTNPAPARGGFDAETLENALVRAPQKIYAQNRAVTAREFESIVLNNRQIARARALPQASLWRHGLPGTVDIVMVPGLTETQKMDLKTLLKTQEEANLQAIEVELKNRSPIGIGSRLRWARYKQVKVEAHITYQGNEADSAVQQRVIRRINRLISPLPTVQVPEDDGASNMITPASGWPFGQQLRLSSIYSQILVDDSSRLLITSLDIQIEHAPYENISCLAADFIQPHTWYAGSGQKLFRSSNNGTGWELVLHLSQDEKDTVLRRDENKNWAQGRPARDEMVRNVCPSPDRAGMVALSSETTVKGALQSSLYLTLDCGESWYQLAVMQESGTALQPGKIEDMAWLVRGSRPILLLATDGGLLEVNLDFDADGSLVDVDFYQVPVLADQLSHPAYALAVVRSRRGPQLVVVALKGRRGLYTSTGDSLRSGTQFTPLAIKETDQYRGEDIRHLNVQYLGDRIFLWAAVMAITDNGQGCYRWQIDQSGNVIDDSGVWISENWSGGSCLAVAFDRNLVYAATAWGGLLRGSIDEQHPTRPPAWSRFPMQDLPHRKTQIEKASREEKRALMEPLNALDARHGVVIVSTKSGIYRRIQWEPNFEHERYENISRRTLSNLKDAVTIPPDWLFIPGDHKIQVNMDDSSSKKDINAVNGTLSGEES
jgi:hypothetical protein